MNERDHLSCLYEIARLLNQEFSLESALRRSLNKTLKILEIDTGWIWLTERDHQSVYLAVSANLPPALSDFPERLSGWCYCIKQYLSNEMDEAINISEIACSRFRDITTGTKDLKFHATIPITVNGQKVGIMNLLTKESRLLTESELSLLGTIGDLIGTTVQRTRLQPVQAIESNSAIHEVLERTLGPQLEDVIFSINEATNDSEKVIGALKKALALQEQLAWVKRENSPKELHSKARKEFQYPETPLSKRELEVLNLIRKGLTNNQIGQRLFITERTVKFHVTSILSKLRAETRTEAVDISLRRGLLSL